MPRSLYTYLLLSETNEFKYLLTSHEWPCQNHPFISIVATKVLIRLGNQDIDIVFLKNLAFEGTFSGHDQQKFVCLLSINVDRHLLSQIFWKGEGNTNTVLRGEGKRESAKSSLALINKCRSFPEVQTCHFNNHQQMWAVSRISTDAGLTTTAHRRSWICCPGMDYWLLFSFELSDTNVQVNIHQCAWVWRAFSLMLRWEDPLPHIFKFKNLNK